MPLDFAPTTQLVADLVAGVRDDQLDDPTPCEGMTVAALLDHLHGLAYAFTLAATKDADALEGDGAPEPDADSLVPGWRTEIPERLETLAIAWKDPSAWEGMTKAGPVELPGEIAALVALDEVVVHGWDLAAATGQPFAPDASSLEAVHGFVASFEPPEDVVDQGGPQLFGPEVEVPADALLLHRVLGLTGRDPSWSA